ncbi:YpoC family protein [Neobacillus thermocopriae]|uniref:YpoC-like domain-containing protein n=1 Tax=Neobacillus thermocopriae TaxID=1215031 RepID=A0A6B3TT61_9BACI|nr:hypothetical protein [Neobacillus thermocopriae]MED3625022.1 hypothetical protein [Neobacillus thermocopriae]MED3712780.1 hypothetical protein [Neobacillus thermocopriae]NEX79882.1 hypothetical protein [Neobacillus thermocopriae]
MNNSSKQVSKILENWTKIKTQIEVLIQERKQKETTDFMQRGIELFTDLLYFTNDIEENERNTTSISQLKIKPVNLEERLSFIKSRPNLYHSFRQLSELMGEQEKLYAKKLVLKKSSK